VQAFLAASSGVIDVPANDTDTERDLGEVLTETNEHAAPFLAVRVWTPGRREGQHQMERTLRYLGRRRIDLMQVHELIDFATHIDTLRRWRAIGHARYLGVVVDRLDTMPALEHEVRTAGLDVAHVPFSVFARAAEERLLPAAADHGVAVLISSPFGDADKLNALRRRPLPGWASELECVTWPQLLMKWILAHPAVHCVLAEAHDTEQVAEYMRAALGPLPDSAQRRRLAAFVEEV
jgi:aryl-alcohol dehydrogenase-like predicted oxidoreductase